MRKTLVTIILTVLFFEHLQAQKLDSVLINIKKHSSGNDNGQIVSTRDSADFLLEIFKPADSSSGKKISVVKQFYPNGKLLLTGKSIVNIYGKNLYLTFEGAYTDFYPNGKEKSTGNYLNNIRVGDITEYYANGTLYAKEKYIPNANSQLIECSDSTNKELATNGNGLWLEFDNERNHVVEKGKVVNGLKEGEWIAFINDSIQYVKLYHKGNFVPALDTAGQIFIAADIPPSYRTGREMLILFLEKNLRIPLAAREKDIQGRVYVSFVVEKDGSLTNIRAIKGPDVSLNDEAVRVVKLSSPWVPGSINNKPVRTQYTIPINFQFR